VTANDNWKKTIQLSKSEIFISLKRLTDSIKISMANPGFTTTNHGKLEETASK